MNIESNLIKGARGLLRWTQRDLAAPLAIPFSTMCYHENGLRMSAQRMRETISLFENAGVSFVDSPEGKGVILWCNKTNGA